MTVVTITNEKYYEIYDELRTSENISDKDYPPYLFERYFERYLKCSPTLSIQRIEGRALVDLTFENEQDYLWFELKYL
jgi:hypothetical protein